MDAGAVPDPATVTRARVLALAPVLAALTVAWSLLDIAFLPGGVLGSVLAVRLAIAVSLLLLARQAMRLPTGHLLRAFLWVQALGFGLMQALFIPAADRVESIGYGLAPFLIAAQLALFPLRWHQTLRLGLAPAAALVLVHLEHLPAMHPAIWSDGWLLVLLLGVAAWTAQAQYRLLAALGAARTDATRDPLTGLGNRRLALERLSQENERHRRHHAPLSVLMLDLDRFKAVNDRWGHAAGDLVIAAAAQAITDELRGCDLGVRFGGEEFLVVLPDTPLDDATRVAERIRRRIGSLRIDTGEVALEVTVSIGVACLQDGETVDSFIARADAALYRAKAAGRDRCVADAAAAVHAGAPA